MNSLFEAIMLICFGLAWPTSIYKSIKSKSTQGKSVVFLYVILIGYISGVTHKFIDNLDYVIILYFTNAIMVSIDIVLYYRNRIIESNWK
ncbi:hypothetical protein [Haloplasma contractile]|uniref:PQ loop repeat protein n=1 Tax=Haloplasma contractile SSD-17B TaxID=1033810 RepID=U2EDB1_9MOLU|nr:hypothetical protein [Haloplasma contractile]ERJ12988.1 hypothetical protein HLPCO_000587 [Haloplasma contractile SSD-17B]